MKKETKLPNGVTPEMVAAWKERYGEKNIKLATLLSEDGRELGDAVIRVPDRKTQGEFEKWVDKNPYKAKEILVNTCVLSPKEPIYADDMMFSAAFNAIVELIPMGKFKLADL